MRFIHLTGGCFVGEITLLATTYAAQDCATCGREAVKSVLRSFDKLVKCDEEGVLKDVRKAAEGVE